mmetsp:Transcript_69687/g.163626  ORF Transcript_69687/g.163626 Transcript_69687/m.163626 type:complete len:426 (-) Transcript_69687:26-1303(-)
MAGASAVFIMDMKGKVIISRNYRGEVPMNITERFQQHVIDAEDAAIKPVFCEDGISFAWIQYNNLYLLAVTQRNSNATLIVAFLYRLAEVLRDYFNELEEESIKDNFVITYELLDEMMDNGYPQTTEVKILREYIKTQSHQLSVEQMRPPTAVTNAVSWRSEGIKHKKNEVFIDVIERVNILVSTKRERLRADVSGEILVNCKLSGMPECKFGMNDKLVMSSDARARSSDKGIALDDYGFHQCVRLGKFDVDREITFIPPDEQFSLMTYRITENIESPFKLIPNVKVLGRTRLELSLQVTAMYDRNIEATNVRIDFPCPKNTAKAHIPSPGHGKARYDANEGAVIWRIRRFPGRHEYSLLAEVELASMVSDKQWVRPPITMDFEVPQFTASGLRVRFLKVQEKSQYKPIKWIRYLTKAGTYEHRI